MKGKIQSSQAHSWQILGNLKVEDLEINTPKYFLYCQFEDCCSKRFCGPSKPFSLRLKIKRKKEMTNLDLLSVFFNDVWLYSPLSGRERERGRTRSSSNREFTSIRKSVCSSQMLGRQCFPLPWNWQSPQQLLTFTWYLLCAVNNSKQFPYNNSSDLPTKTTGNETIIIPILKRKNTEPQS